MSSPFTVERDEMVEFALRWDRLPVHIDDDAANSAFGHGGVTAPGVLVMAIRTRLIHELPEPYPPAVIAAFGWDDVRFHAPVRAGDTLRLRHEWLTKRQSESKPDRGIVTAHLSLINQDDVAVMSNTDSALVRRRNHERNAD